MSIAMPPATFEVLEQRVRISPDGRSVVDVTLLFPDMEGIANVDVRVTKV